MESGDPCGMEHEEYPRSELERVMKVREVLLRAMAGKIRWDEAAEILGSSPRSLRRWRAKMEEVGADALIDRRRKRPSPRRIPVEEIRRVLGLFRERYCRFNVRHFHQIAVRDFGVRFSYTFLRLMLQEAGLVKKRRKRGVHRRERDRRASFGEMLQLDGSTHAWLRLRPELKLTLLQIVDDATSRLLYAQLEEGETTMSVLRALHFVVSEEGIPASLYTDRASWAFETPVAGAGVDKAHLTCVGQVLKRLGVEHIPSYSPQGRGRSERMNRTLQDRLVNELEVAGINTIEEANRYLREVYRPDHNARFCVPPRDAESAFVRTSPVDDLFYEGADRVVAKDNVVSWEGVRFQISKQPGRATCAGLHVEIRRFLDGSVQILKGPQRLGVYSADGKPMEAAGPGGKPRTDAVSHRTLGRRERTRRPQLPQARLVVSRTSALRASA
jgi:transposase